MASDDVSSLVVASRGIAMPDIDHCDDGFISNDNCAISHYAHNWKNDSPSDGFDISLTFSHFSQLKKSVDQYAEANNFKTRYHAKDYFSEDLFSNAYPDTPFVPKLPYRGRFVCSPLSARLEKKSQCPFQICYLFDRKCNAYTIQKQSNFLHSHSLGIPRMMTLGGKIYVNLASDLTHQEDTLIQYLSTARMSIPEMSSALERIFPGRAFTSELLHRQKGKHLDERYGTDRHDIPGLFQKCHDVRSLGGIFEIEPSSSDFGIQSIHVQTKLMGDYANVYGDLMMAYGTHKLSQYDFVFIIWMGIDGLGKSVFLGTTCNFSENADTIVRGAKLFFPSDHVDTKIRAGYFQEYFDPFADNEITITENVIDANTPCLKRGGVNVDSSLAVDSALHKKIKEVGSD